MKMSNKTYDFLKRTITVIIPAFLTMFNGLALVWKWNIPVEAIDTTVCLIATFVGVVLGISSNKYNAEEVNQDGWGEKE